MPCRVPRKSLQNFFPSAEINKVHLSVDLSLGLRNKASLFPRSPTAAELQDYLERCVPWPPTLSTQARLTRRERRYLTACQC